MNVPVKHVKKKKKKRVYEPAALVTAQWKQGHDFGFNTEKVHLTHNMVINI